MAPKVQTAATRAKIAARLRGHKVSFTTKKKMSLAAQERYRLCPELRQKIGDAIHEAAVRRREKLGLPEHTRRIIRKALAKKQKLIARMPDGSPIKYWDENGLHCYDSNGTLIK